LDTPELDQLYRRYQRYENLAKHYQAVLEGLQSAEVTADPDAGTITFHTDAFKYVPKSIPRGKPTQWYLEKAQYYTAKASDARDLYWSLHDAAEKRAWEALDRDGKLAQLHEIAKRLDRTKELIQEWRAKIPAWERKRAEQGPSQTDAEAFVQDWMERFSDPRPMIETLEESLQAREADRDWLLERL
jgi:DNA repair exonuclease SbcCD ATPase subunit